jgi:hypothetical protein
MVHDPQAGKTGLVCGPGDLRKLAADLFWATGPGKVGDLQSNFHLLPAFPALGLEMRCADTPLG